jgi:AraC-like DNA-binding protein
MGQSSISRKPALEKVNTEFGSSFTVKYYEESAPQQKPPFWHFHPEVELVYVKGGSGKRHIGQHLSYYQSGDLVLIGSMLPHTGFTDRLIGNESETVIQFNSDCFGSDFFGLEEMKDIEQLLQRAKAGIAFHGRVRNDIGARMEGLVKLSKFTKLLELLNILQDLAVTEEYTLLNADGFVFEVENSDNYRINIIYDYVQKHFRKPLPLEEIAAVANMTVPSFCRYFKRISGKTFTRFVNEIRIVNACKLLTEEQDTISNVSYESGFNNFSHFNRQFKEVTGKSPSEYRKQFVKIFNESD